jgi:hypothetical protein
MSMFTEALERFLGYNSAIYLGSIQINTCHLPLQGLPHPAQHTRTIESPCKHYCTMLHAGSREFETR